MTINYTDNFLRQLKKSNVQIRKTFKQRLLLFVENPNDLEFNNHPLQREYVGFRSIDITADYRAVYREVIQKDDTYIYFISLGTHHQLYER
ncbi:MAG: hypothetical protein COX78_03870 [Candidatus Levybacteria bacterium CG_4_10_14_0_2_um_filter_35_8]|nr:MAG: hypothetical protein COW87_04310 [Candidatus Levybacteria bacterium CG22_combo_CG10-13_8_21_14_all_35_11]PIY94476.1 MAG: hypothetical protein COY68_02865 [Candidatus Levybacteria bacterium CG_4_10_14_0_8_um_filter_35_23]PIZ98082.1 MAG: hypothetical protein COX78_03870 [Candidatus Levybacteria bacterium CG_4_10_14_0_2_um_filter_35_8]PJC54604.1 MAG: hypothetical protein CO028_01570 [Candidatus Levybacteria bacterium CG_4_9_14_0_2_um_filter_35_21]